MSRERPPAADGARPAGPVGEGGIPVVIDSVELAHLMHAVMNDKPREQFTDEDTAHFRSAMDTLLRAAQTPWQAHPDHLRAGIGSLLEILEDVLQERGRYDTADLREHGERLADLSGWTAGPSHIGELDGDRAPCGPPTAVDTHQAAPKTPPPPDVDAALRAVKPLRVVPPS